MGGWVAGGLDHLHKYYVYIYTYIMIIGICYTTGSTWYTWFRTGVPNCLGNSCLFFLGAKDWVGKHVCSMC